ncbi:unannotated protein [freshwater metagenome]|uniref:Unannotated protein n=1 Tax=freshwater metagenome TaxID=449393 RepID=A0A6J6D478_9ZZZZ
MAKHPLLPTFESAIRFGCNVIDAALEQREVCHLGCHLRNKLNGASSDANHANSFASQIVIVFPSSRMKRGALKGLESLNVWDAWAIELPKPTHHNLCLDLFSRCPLRLRLPHILTVLLTEILTNILTDINCIRRTKQLKTPEAQCLIPRCRGHLGIELNMWSEVVVCN